MTPEELKLLQKILKDGDLNSILNQVAELDNNELNTYVCTNCNNSIESEKKRKRCPKCGKHKLVLGKPEQSPEDLEREIKNRWKELGIKERRKDSVSSRQSISKDRIKKMIYISHSPDGEDFSEDKEIFDKKVKFKVTARNKPKFKKRSVNCRECNSLNEILPELYYDGWICGRCIKNKKIL